MKKILNALFLTLLAVFTFSSCSDVPAPYDILGEGDVPGLTGDGSKDNPYTVSDLKAKADGTTVAWVQAYIVAGIKSSTDMSISSENDVVFGTQPTGVKATAFLIADDRGESDYKNCSAVNLSGKTAGCSEVKAALNLVDNATTPLPRLVTLKGTLVKNTWGLPGLKEVTTAILEDGTIIGEGGDEPTPPVGGVTFFEESFASDKGTFTIEDKTRPTKVSEIWKWESYTPETGGTASKYMKASAYISATEKEASESWLISPVVNLTKATKASLTFEHAHKFCGDPAKELTIWVKESTASDWTQATIPTYGTNQDWKFVSSGNIDLASYIGKNIQFAFKYISTTSNVGTWEVKNVKIVGEGEGGGPVDPDPAEGKLIFTEKYGSDVDANILTATTAISSFTHWDNSYSYSATTADIRAIAHRTPDNTTETKKVNNIWFPASKSAEFVISGINIAGHTKFIVAYEVASNVYATTETDNLNNLKLTLNEKEVTPISKEVIGNGKVSGIFHEMQVEISVAGIDNSTLKFSTNGTDNKFGIRLYNIRLYAVDGEGGGTDPEQPGDKVYTSNITLPESTNTDANKASGGKVIIKETEYPILKLGTSSALGFWSSPMLQAGVSKLSFYAVGWKAKTGQLTVVIENGGTFEGGETSKVISLVGNDGATGNSPFTITPADTDFYEYTMTGITASTTIKFTTEGATSDKRAIILGINIK